ncbi:MAG TPA: hypothetical protein VK968_18750 [Roseimicrobium sp.]|nr:hypothetical protein [Roseimicrobium sp.]
MKTKIPLFFFALCLLTGCIEFATQTLSYRHDEKTDTLYIFQDYQGIFGASKTNGLEPDEIEQLASVVKGGRTFFFNNWITEYNQTTAKELLAKEKGEIDKDPEYEAAIRALAGLAVENIRVENVGLYKNKEGQLCGAQRITIQHVSRLLTAVNKTIPYAAKELAKEDGKSEAEKQLLLKYANSEEPAIQLKGNQIKVRFPLSSADYHEFTSDKQAAGIRAAGGVIAYRDGILSITLGERDAKGVSITLPFSEKPYVSNAMTEAGRHGIKESFDAKQTAALFLAAPHSSDTTK